MVGIHVEQPETGPGPGKLVHNRLEGVLLGPLPHRRDIPSDLRFPLKLRVAPLAVRGLQRKRPSLAKRISQRGARFAYGDSAIGLHGAPPPRAFKPPGTCVLAELDHPGSRCIKPEEVPPVHRGEIHLQKPPRLTLHTQGGASIRRPKRQSRKDHASNIKPEPHFSPIPNPPDTGIRMSSGMRIFQVLPSSFCMKPRPGYSSERLVSATERAS